MTFASLIFPCLLGISLSMVVAQPPPPSQAVTVKADLSKVAATTGVGLFSGNFDWHLNSEEPPAWVNSSINIMKIDDPKTIYLASQMSPGHLRIVSFGIACLPVASVTYSCVPSRVLCGVALFLLWRDQLRP